MLFTAIVFLSMLREPAMPQAVNSASFRPAGLPGSGVAQGSIFVLFGTVLGPSGLTKAESLPLPTHLAGTSIRVTVGGFGTDAFILYTSDKQVAAVLPSSTPVGNGIVTVTYNNRVSSPTSISVKSTAFGIFTQNAAGTGPAVVQNFVSAAEVSLNGLNNAVHPGQTAVLWGTGLGPVPGGDSDKPPVGDLPVDVSVLVGGRAAKVSYKGRAPDFPGVDQINFEVPDGVFGCYVPVAVKAARVVSNYASMAITKEGSTCADPTSMAAEDINAAAQSGESRIALVRLTSRGPGGWSASRPRTEGRAEYRKRTAAQLQASPGWWLPQASIGTCTATWMKVDRNNGELEPSDPTPISWMNGGSSVVFSGPAGDASIQRQNWGGYLGAAENVFLRTGRYVVWGGRQGTEVGSFQTAVQVPAGITWTNEESLTRISRRSDLVVNWTGGSGDLEYVLIRGVTSVEGTGLRGLFACAQAASAGTMTVPADVLSVLPASTDGDSKGLLEVGSVSRLDKTRFTAPGLQGGYAQFGRMTVIPAEYQ